MAEVARAGTSWSRVLPVPLLDGAIGLGLAVAALADTAHRAGAPHPWTELAAVVTTGAIALRTRAPLAMVLCAAAGMLGYALLPGSGTPLWTFLAVLVIGFSAGAGLAGRRLLVALGVLLVTGYTLQLSSVDRGDPSDNSFSEVWISPLVIIGGPAFAGVLLRRSRRQTSELRRLGAELAAERELHAEAVATEERNRIARELHDVISHSVSVMVVQAGAAEQMLPVGAAAREQVHAVRETGKEALSELRRQLGVLRDGRPEPPVSLPGLAELPALVARDGATLHVEGVPADSVAPGLALTVYRVVQEALTNARRHAPGAEVCVTIRHHADGIDILVQDGGGGRGLGGGTGNGLRGMRERVELYGGHVDAGPRPDIAGWRVHARLPLVPTCQPQPRRIETP